MKYITGIVAVLILLVVGYRVIDTKRHEEEAQPSNVTQPQGDPTFTWVYRTYQKNEFTYSDISLTATYPSGTSLTKPVGTVQGTCSDYPTPDKDVYGKSTMIMCYLAGFGDYYKVVKSGDTYQVLHKEFTEAGPDYNPPVGSYERVSEF